MGAIGLEHVQMVWARVALHEVVAARDSVLLAISIADAFERCNARPRSIKVFDADQDIQHRLRWNVRNCRAPDVLHVKNVNRL
jgi:hypothetical protein